MGDPDISNTWRPVFFLYQIYSFRRDLNKHSALLTISSLTSNMHPKISTTVFFPYPHEGLDLEGVRACDPPPPPPPLRNLQCFLASSWRCNFQGISPRVYCQQNRVSYGEIYLRATFTENYISL